MKVTPLRYREIGWFCALYTFWKGCPAERDAYKYNSAHWSDAKFKATKGFGALETGRFAQRARKKKNQKAVLLLPSWFFFFPNGMSRLVKFHTKSLNTLCSWQYSIRYEKFCQKIEY